MLNMHTGNGGAGGTDKWMASKEASRKPTSAPWGRCSLGLGQEPLHGQQPEGVNVEFLPGAIASGNDALGHLDGEVLQAVCSSMESILIMKQN
eukprot:407633-Pelagomonas_calceolata.AAC.1